VPRHKKKQPTVKNVADTDQRSVAFISQSEYMDTLPTEVLLIILINATRDQKRCIWMRTCRKWKDLWINGDLFKHAGSIFEHASHELLVTRYISGCGIADIKLIEVLSKYVRVDYKLPQFNKGLFGQNPLDTVVALSNDTTVISATNYEKCMEWIYMNQGLNMLQKVQIVDRHFKTIDDIKIRFIMQTKISEVGVIDYLVGSLFRYHGAVEYYLIKNGLLGIANKYHERNVNGEYQGREKKTKLEPVGWLGGGPVFKFSEE